MKRTADISDFLQPLRDKPYQAYLSNALQVADVLDWVLQQLGKSEVWQTSFSISEEFIRRLFFIEKSGLVTKFNLVLDHKATNKTLKLWAFITQVINTTYLADNHSKVLLVRSQKGEVVSIITSQNLTRGNRCESAVVTTDLDIFRTLHAQIQDLITIPAEVLRSDIADRTTEVSQRYLRGKAASKVKLHHQEMMLAQVGSPLAIENAHRNLLDMEDDE